MQHKAAVPLSFVVRHMFKSMNIPELCVEDIEQTISKIDSADFEKLTIEDFEEYLTPLFRCYKVTVPRFERGLYLYRGRTCKQPKNIKEITYPPAEIVKRYGRANSIGETFFYAATARAVPFFELNLKKGDYIALSRWKTTDKLLVNHIGFSKECREYLRSNRTLDEIYDFVKSTKSHGDLNSLVHDYLAYKFSKLVNSGEEHYYKLTIAISRKLFKSDIFSGLLYPTIAITGNADNILLKKDFVDTNLELKSVEYIEIKEARDRKYDIQVVDSATKINEKGDLLWSGRGLQWQLKEKGQELLVKSEGGEWIAYDRNGNRIDPE